MSYNIVPFQMQNPPVISIKDISDITTNIPFPTKPFTWVVIKGQNNTQAYLVFFTKTINNAVDLIEDVNAYNGVFMIPLANLN